MGALGAKSGGFLANLPIRTKILMGFGSVVLVLLIVASVAYGGAVKTGEAFSDYSQRVQEVEIVRQLDRDMVDLRRHVREYANLGQAEEASRSRDIAADLRKQLAVALDVIKAPESHRRLDSAAASYTSYLADFDSVTKLKAEQDTLVHQGLEPSAATFQKNVDDLLAAAQAEVGGTRDVAYAAVMQHGLQARLYTAKMVSSHIAGFGDKAVAELAKTKVILGKLIETEPAAEQAKLGEIKKAAESYEAALVRISATNEQLDKLINTDMTAKAQSVAADMLAVRDAGIEEMHRIEIQAHSVQSTSETLTLVLALVGLILGSGIALTVGSGISRPVVAMSGSMNSLAAGNKAITILGLERGDELGGMARAVEVFRASMIENDRMAAEQQAQAAKSEAHARQIERLAEAYDQMATKVLDSVAAAATQLRTSASSMSDTAETTTTRSSAVAAAAEQASSNVQTVAAASEELTASIHEISRQVVQSSTIANSAVAEANHTNDQVRSLADAAQKIGDVVSLITDIASQTNLLALNATIEAARAGEAGKGFAVVANEVKTLANQTARATDEISVQITAVQAATRDAVAAIAQIGATIGQVNDIATTIASAVEQQGAATQEIARNAQQAATGTHEVTTNIAGVSGAAREAGHAAHDVLSAATDLSRQCEDFRASTQKFLQDVRSA
jgi:methyl-accepting chemotaxis protein